AHEVRSPLFAISTAAEVLEKDASEAERPYSALILEQVERLRNLTVDLLELGRPNTAWLMSDADVYDLIQKAKQDLEVSSPNAAGKLLRRRNGDGMIHGNPEKIAQVFFNILQNAVQHSPQIQNAVEVGVTESNNEVIVSVKDCGAGISPENMPHLFEPFFTTRKGGVGLGLIIAKQIVEAHKGNIRAYNNSPAPGCTFEISFPRINGTTGTA